MRKANKKYSQEVYDYILQNYPNKNTIDVAEYLNLTTKEVSDIASKYLKIHKDKDFKPSRRNGSSLTTEQAEFILNNYSTMKNSEIQETIGVPYNILKSFASNNHLSKKDSSYKNRSIFTKEQEEYIINHYHNTQSLDMCKILGCDIEILHRWCHSHGLKKDDEFTSIKTKYKNGGLSYEQKIYILQNYENMSNNDIAEKLGITKEDIHSYASNKKLKKDNYYAISSNHVWEDMIIEHASQNIYNYLGNETEPMLSRDELYKSKYGKYYINKDYFEKIDNEWKAYWLGFLYADGCVRFGYDDKTKKNIASLKLILSSADKNHLEKLKNSVQSDAPIRHRTINLKGKNFEADQFEVCNQKFVSDLVNLGCVQNKTLILQFPSEDIIPKELMRHFIRGFFDGDGCIHINIERKNISLNFTGMRHFLEPLQNLFEEQLNVTHMEIADDKRSKASTLAYGGLINCLKIYRYMYKDANIYLDRKLKKFNTLLCLG